MQIKNFSSGLAGTSMRLIVFVAMLVSLFGNVTGVAAAPPLALGTVTVGAQSGTLTYGTAGSATFSVTVTRTVFSPSNFNASVSGLPAGATGSFSLSNPVSFFGSSRTITLTVNTLATTPAGAVTITVTAQNGAITRIGTQTLTVAKANQTITFGVLANKTPSDPDFNVSASASSGLAVSFGASGACTVVGTLVHITGAGSCTITASQAGNTNYNAAPNVIRSFTIAAAGPAVSFDLCATAGTASMPAGVNVPIWGYVLGDCTGSPTATLPGPTLIVNAGSTVNVTLHNNLSETTGVLFQGQSMRPDLAGAPGGGSKTYTFAATNPGTFLYEAALIPGAQHQVAMGLYGALVVRPATATQAYNSSTTAFDDEAVLVLSELDPLLNASPSGYDMRKFAPRYFLINGKAYPGTASITTTGGRKLLLRYVNAGLQAHAMSLLGFPQAIIADDGSPLAHSHKMSSETIAPGQTLDVIVSPPSAITDGSKFALYDANMLLRNSTGLTTNAGLGGMLTFLTVNSGIGSSDPDTQSPLLSSLALSPNPSTGAVTVALSFTANDTTTGNSNVTAAEYWIDAGAHTPITVGSPAPVVNLAATIPSGLTAGTHVVSVRAQDAASNWSTTGTINLVVDNAGPATSNLSLTPNPSNGAVTVALSFNASDSASGNSNVTAAEYWIDAGAHQPVTVSSPAPVKTLNATIPAGLTPGTHVVHARSQDALGNWGAEAPTINLVVDNTGPFTTSVSAAPDPNNGSLGLSTSIQAVRVSADFTDGLTGGANLSAAEGFLDAPGTTGTGFVFVANDGNFNSPAEGGIADIPLVVINTLSSGPHPICVHAKDAAGNWGAFNCTYSLTIDKVAPTVSSINRIGASPTGATSVQWQVTFSESVTGVSSSNFTIVRTGLTGTSTITSVTGGGTTWTVTATTGTGSGTIGLNLTSPANIQDLASNAMTTAGLPFVGQTFTITPPPQPSLYFSTAGSSNPPGVGGTADDADIYFYNGTAFSRSIDVSTITNPLPTGANVDGFDRVDATHFYMSFNGSVTIALPGPDLTVQDEDVVFYNAGTWSVYFDGTPTSRGLSGSDVDAISVVGGVLYFSTDNTTVPAGVSGGGDDADIYSWNGTSFARVYDASALGWSTANVDGFTRVDATHFYVSYSSDTTVPGIGTVQDEDVVFYNAGTWSVYFDGTVLNLTSSNLDIDAFDLP